MLQRIGAGRSPSTHPARWIWPSGHNELLAPSGFALLRGRQPTEGWLELGGYVHRSLRRRGQLLVVVGALLGALIGLPSA